MSRFFYLLFSLGSRPTWELVGVFCLGVLFLSVASNWVYDLARNPAGLFSAHSVGIAIALAIMLGSAYGLYARNQRKILERVAIQADFTESATVPRREGLIWLLSPGSVEHPAFAILHHYGKEVPHTLEHCWLILTKGDRSVQEALEALEDRLRETNTVVRLHPVHIPRPDVESTYRAVDRIYQEELVDKGLVPEQVIADITGGLKPMTTGMALACLLRDLDIEYVETERDEWGRPIDGTQRVVIVDVDFFWYEQQA
jgi:hypothetical protein